MALQLGQGRLPSNEIDFIFMDTRGHQDAYIQNKSQVNSSACSNNQSSIDLHQLQVELNRQNQFVSSRCPANKLNQLGNPESTQNINESWKMGYSELSTKYSQLRQFYIDICGRHNALQKQQQRYQQQIFHLQQEIQQRNCLISTKKQLVARVQQLEQMLADKTNLKAGSSISLSNATSRVTSNQFYIEELQRANEVLKKQNKRYSQIIMRKLRQSIEHY